MRRISASVRVQKWEMGLNQQTLSRQRRQSKFPLVGGQFGPKKERFEEKKHLHFRQSKKAQVKGECIKVISQTNPFNKRNNL